MKKVYLEPEFSVLWKAYDVFLASAMGEDNVDGWKWDDLLGGGD